MGLLQPRLEEEYLAPQEGNHPIDRRQWIEIPSQPVYDASSLVSRDIDGNGMQVKNPLAKSVSRAFE